MSLRQWSLALLPLSLLTLTACSGSRAEGPGIGGEGNLGSGGAITAGGHGGSVSNGGAANGPGGLTGMGGAGAKAGSGEGGTSGSGAVGGGTSGNSGASGTTSVACPPEVPMADGACSPTVGRCTWGDAPLLACRTSGSCTASGWQLTAPPAYCTSTAPGCAALQRCWLEMVRSINEIGHLTGKQTITEVAENAEIIQMLTSLGWIKPRGTGWRSRSQRVLKSAVA